MKKLMELEAKEKEAEESEEMDEYELEHCLETLLKAEEIKQDPKKMAQLKPLLAKKKKAILSFDGLRELAEKKSSSQED